MDGNPPSVPDSYKPTGSLYRYDPDGTLTVQEQGGISCANGTGWSPDDRTMYFTDSVAKVSLLSNTQAKDTDIAAADYLGVRF